MMKKMMNKTNEELEMVELNDDELNQVIGGAGDGRTGRRAFLGTGAAILGLVFFQIPGAIIAAIWGSDDTPLFPNTENNSEMARR